MNYYTTSRKKVKSPKIFSCYRKETHLSGILKIVYYLFYAPTPQTRSKFIHDYPSLNEIYEQVLEEISKELDLPVKRCVHCGIRFLPDYRTLKQQKNCPYGCVEYNHRKNIKRANERYREKLETRMKQSEYNQRYRERKKNGELCNTNSHSLPQKDPEKLRRQIVYVYHKLNPHKSKEKLVQLESILRKMEKRCKNERDSILIPLEKGSKLNNRAHEGGYSSVQREFQPP